MSQIGSHIGGGQAMSLGICCPSFPSCGDSRLRCKDRGDSSASSTVLPVLMSPSDARVPADIVEPRERCDVLAGRELAHGHQHRNSRNPPRLPRVLRHPRRHARSPRGPWCPVAEERSPACSREHGGSVQDAQGLGAIRDGRTVAGSNRGSTGRY